MVAVALTENAYGKIIEKQGQIYIKHKVRIELIKIASAAIIRGMDDVEEELGLKMGIQNKISDYDIDRKTVN